MPQKKIRKPSLQTVLVIRFVDFILAVLLTLPFVIVSVFLVILNYGDWKSVFFVQERIGRGGRPFKMWKFRTMAKETQNVPSHLVSPESVTRHGVILRRYKVDELPQILNVLSGQMSFIGPRPCLPSQLRLRSLRCRHGVQQLRPGISGLAQIWKIDMSTEKRLVACEKLAQQRSSVCFYFYLIIVTATGHGRGDAISTMK